MLIAGASGLVGRRLIPHLVESGKWQIRASSRTKRVWPAGVEGRVTDIDRPDTLVEACRDMDVVINLASMGERLCAIDPEGALRVNAGGTLRLASAASTAKVSRFIQVSTSKVYGNNPGGVVTEDTVCKPQSHYAVTHHAAEAYAALQHPNCVVFRLSNAFGAPVDASASAWSVIVNEMCRQAAQDGKITIRSSGRSWRNFVPMEDVLGALQHAMGKLAPGTYNLGSRQSLTLLAVAELVARVCQETLSFAPAILTGSDDRDVQHIPLDYRIDRLMASGFVPNASFEHEVAGTLRAAKEG